MKRITLLIFMSLLIGHQTLYSQSKYLIQDDEGFDYIINISEEGNNLLGFTRPKALLDYASKFQYGLVKLLSPLKHPEIIRFKANLKNGEFEGVYNSLFSEYKIIGNIKQDSISYSLYDKTNNELFKKLKGIRIKDYEKKDYKKLVENLISITESNIYDPKFPSSKKWRKFKNTMRENSSKISDDLELQIGFFTSIRPFDFSHYYLVSRKQQNNTKEENFTLKEISKSIAILKIRKFSGKSIEIDSLLDSIYNKKYDNLIIDLRDNPGGDFATALPLANFLTNEKLINGFFPNKNWYSENNRLPNKSDISAFNIFTEGTFKDFNTKASSKYGVSIQTKGTKQKFKGRVFFLVNENTGSTAEALIIGVKEYGLGKIIGKRTAGSLLSAETFNLDDDIMILVPTNDFVSFEGYRVDKQGVKPDIKVKNQDELEYVIKLLRENE